MKEWGDDKPTASSPRRGERTLMTVGAAVVWVLLIASIAMWF